MDARSKGIEVSGRSVDDAVQQALQKLGLSQDEVEVEVIKQGSRGLLGLLSEEALVRVTPIGVAQASARPHQAEPRPEAEAAERLAESEAAERLAESEAAKRLAESEAAKRLAESEAAERLAESEAAKRLAESEAEEPERVEWKEEQQPRVAHAGADQDAVAQQGAGVLQKLLDYMGVPGRVSKEPLALKGQGGAPSTVLNITGDDLGLLIGRRGETLRDLQFLTSLIVSRNSQHWPGLSVDVEHYKARREKSLIDLARRMADRVRTTAQAQPLEPMPPYERRIVHLALRDDPDVRTESSGQDDKRKVVIYPKE